MVICFLKIVYMGLPIDHCRFLLLLLSLHLPSDLEKTLKYVWIALSWPTATDSHHELPSVWEVKFECKEINQQRYHVEAPR